MKINHLLLSLVSISLTVISTRAASTVNDNEVVQLPAYTVEVPRQTAAEKQIARNLAELRAEARKPIAIKTEVPLVNARNDAVHNATKPAPVMVVARS